MLAGGGDPLDHIRPLGVQGGQLRLQAIVALGREVDRLGRLARRALGRVGRRGRHPAGTPARRGTAAALRLVAGPVRLGRRQVDDPADRRRLRALASAAGVGDPVAFRSPAGDRRTAQGSTTAGSGRGARSADAPRPRTRRAGRPRIPRGIGGGPPHAHIGELAQEVEPEADDAGRRSPGTVFGSRDPPRDGARRAADEQHDLGRSQNAASRCGAPSRSVARRRAAARRRAPATCRPVPGPARARRPAPAARTRTRPSRVAHSAAPGHGPIREQPDLAEQGGGGAGFGHSVGSSVGRDGGPRNAPAANGRIVSPSCERSGRARRRGAGASDPRARGSSPVRVVLAIAAVAVLAVLLGASWRCRDARRLGVPSRAGRPAPRPRPRCRRHRRVRPPRPQRPRPPRDGRAILVAGRLEPAAVRHPLPARDGRAARGWRAAERLQARLEALRARLSIPGCRPRSCGTTAAPGRRSGMADVTRKRRADDRERVRPGLDLQDVHAAVILQLVEEGRLTLTSPSLPGCRTTTGPAGDRPDAARPHERAARLLLQPPHRQGAPIRPRRDLDAGACLVAGAEAPRGPRHDWSYSNTNYLLLGELVREVSGRALPREVRIGSWTRLASSTRGTRRSRSRSRASPPATGGRGGRRQVRPVRVARPSSVMPSAR